MALVEVTTKDELTPAPTSQLFGWLANGTTGKFTLADLALAILGGVHNIESYGEVIADDGTPTAANMAPVLQAACNAVHDTNGGVVLITKDIFTASAVTFKSRTIFVGAGAGVTIRNLASAIFDGTDASKNKVVWTNLGLTARGGDAIKLGFASYMYVSKVTFNTVLFSAISTTGQLLDSVIEDFDADHDHSSTVPIFYLRSSDNAINGNIIQSGRFTSAGNYCIWIENTNTSGYCSDNLIQRINCEQTRGGFLKLLSGHSNEVRNVAVYDLQAIGATTRDLIYLGRSSGSHQQTRHTLIHKFIRRDGSLGSGLKDIKLQTSVCGNTVIEACDAGTFNGFTIDWGGNTQCVGRDMGPGVTHENVAGGYARPLANMNDVARLSGTGSPEGAIVGNPGDTYQRTDGGAGTSFYVKESGSATNTGWVAK